MNVERLKALQRYLRNKQIEGDVKILAHFNMSRVIHTDDCGTSACIAGTAALMWGTKSQIERCGDFSWIDVGRELLDLDYTTAEHLFFPKGVLLGLVNPEEAAQAIQNVLDCGSPRWYEVLRDE